MSRQKFRIAVYSGDQLLAVGGVGTFREMLESGVAAKPLTMELIPEGFKPVESFARDVARSAAPLPTNPTKPKGHLLRLAVVRGDQVIAIGAAFDVATIRGSDVNPDGLKMCLFSDSSAPIQDFVRSLSGVEVPATPEQHRLESSHQEASGTRSATRPATRPRAATLANRRQGKGGNRRRNGNGSRSRKQSQEVKQPPRIS